MDKKKLSQTELEIAEHIKGIMGLLRIEKTRSNEDTPFRIAKMYSKEMFRNVDKDISELNKEMTLFQNPCPCSNTNTTLPIVMAGIKFDSMCEHHWMPFFGEVEISYTPDTHIIGLSKLPRVVQWFSKKPQTQENLTAEIGFFLVSLLHPKNLKVVIKAEHTCVTCRGIESKGTTTQTGYTYTK